MVNGSDSINVFIRKLNHPFFFTSKTCRAAMQDDHFVLENYRKDVVEESALILFLLKSILFPPLRLLIPNVLYYTQECSITDKVFQVCSKYPGKYRQTLLNLLAHMWLTQDQLYKLNHMIDTPEAFCKLFVLYAENKMMSEKDFASFLAANEKHIKKIDLAYLIKENNVCISSDKINAIHQIKLSYYD